MLSQVAMMSQDYPTTDFTAVLIQDKGRMIPRCLLLVMTKGQMKAMEQERILQIQSWTIPSIGKYISILGFNLFRLISYNCYYDIHILNLEFQI